MNVARHRGASASGHAGYRGEGHHRNHTNSNHAKTTASTTPAAIASISAALSDIGNSFGFALPRSHSDSQSLRSASPKAFATISVARDSARRASVSYRQIAGLYYDQVKDPKFSVA